MKFLSISALASVVCMLYSADAASLKGTAGKKAPAVVSPRSLKSLNGPGYRECVISEKEFEVEMECRSTNVPDMESQDDEEDNEAVESTDTELNEEEEEMEEGMANEESDSVPAPEARGISIEPSLEIRDKIKYKVEADKKGIEVKVEYEQEFEETEPVVGQEEVSGESETQFEIVFESIIEYAKNMSSDSIEGQAYDWESDEVVQTLDLESWSEFTAVANDTTGLVSFFSATTEDEIVSFNFTISRADQGEKLTANTMKIDMHIIDFPWMRNDTYLALTSSVKSNSKVEMEYDDEATAVLAQEEFQRVLAPEDVKFPFDTLADINGVAAIGEYKWETTAEVIPNVTDAPEVDTTIDVTSTNPESSIVATARQSLTFGQPSGVNIQVVASSPPGNETAQNIAYSFVGEAAQGASHIFWDPEAGIGYQESTEYTIGGEPVNSDLSSAASSPLLIGSALGGFVVVALSVIGF